MSERRVVALSGGVGGAKLALGLAHQLPPESLTVIANTADDFEHLGLYIAPDLDTVMYTLAGINNIEQGWGLAGESWQTMEMLKRYRADTWFQLGDRDIATHLVRSQWRSEGVSLTEITARLCRQLGVDHRILPMCDEKVSTCVHSDQGDLPFQHYFVREQCRPAVNGFTFNGIDNSTLSEPVRAALCNMDLLLVCPSNPFVSVAPILAVRGMREALVAQDTPRVVVSPIVGGIAIKGPAAKMMQELSMPVTPVAVARHYRDFATHFVLDSCDAAYKDEIEAMGMQVIVCPTIMRSLEDRKELAQTLLEGF